MSGIENKPFALNPLPHFKSFCSTYPGFALPHVWLTQTACGPTISTLDIVGKGRFTILTGVGGEAWKDAAAKIARKCKIELVAHSIGFHQDYHDAYSQWEAKGTSAMRAVF
jgi:hypothetical protein